jgi:hypothetical protein
LKFLFFKVTINLRIKSKTKINVANNFVYQFVKVIFISINNSKQLNILLILTVADEFIKDLEDLDDDAARRFKEKHSLDSDEEDENTEKYDIMHEDDIEGFEKSASSSKSSKSLINSSATSTSFSVRFRFDIFVFIFQSLIFGMVKKIYLIIKIICISSSIVEDMKYLLKRFLQ